MAVFFIFLGKSCTPQMSTQNSMIIDLKTQQDLAMKVGFHSIIFWSVMLCGLLSSNLLSKEEEDGTVAMTLSRPVSRAQFLAGKILSVIMISTFNLILLSGVFLFLFYVEMKQFNPFILLSFLTMVIALILYTLMTIVLSFFIPRIAAPLVSMCIYLFTLWIALPAYFDSIKYLWIPSSRIEMFYKYLPKFGDIQFLGASFIGVSVKNYDIISVCINALFYIFFFWFLILFLFKKRSF
jgi:ABC-type transport system involved in multi-copper enzyme maturation permease subunit